MGVLQQPSFEDDHDVREYIPRSHALASNVVQIYVPTATVDEHLQKVGADAFNKFQRRVMNLDKEV